MSVFAEAADGFDLAMFEEEARKIADVRAQALADDISASNESALADDDEIQFFASYGFTFLRCSKTHTIPGGGKTIKVKATAKYSHNPKEFFSFSKPVYHVEGTAIANNITFTHVQTKSWINNGGKKNKFIRYIYRQRDCRGCCKHKFCRQLPSKQDDIAQKEHLHEPGILSRSNPVANLSAALAPGNTDLLMGLSQNRNQPELDILGGHYLVSAGAGVHRHFIAASPGDPATEIQEIVRAFRVRMTCPTRYMRQNIESAPPVY